MRRSELEQRVRDLERDIRRLKEDADPSPVAVIWTFLRDETWRSGETTILDVGYAARQAIRSGKITRKQALEAVGLRKEDIG